CQLLLCQSGSLPIDNQRHLIAQKGNVASSIANNRCEALASLKGCFFMFLFQSPSIFPLNQKYGCPLNFDNFTGGGWCFVAENKKRESN
ncbi:MAG: hypothetical protein SPH48_08270, partial [Sodaliphilus sp.]|nr:hypothetical protein [Sodaliphilus sp.]